MNNEYFEYTLIVTRTLGHILCQILVAKIPIGHRGKSNPRTSDIESVTLEPYQITVCWKGARGSDSRSKVQGLDPPPLQ